jgi:hypothetical protein
MMPSENGLVRTPPVRPTADRIAIDEVSRRPRPEMVPVNNKISCSLMLPIAEEDMHQYIQDPVAALPPAVYEVLPKIGIVLAPYLEKASARAGAVVVNVQDVYHGLLREELSAEVHGEVDEKSWRLKQALLRRPMAARKDGKPFRDYARQSFEDTMTLYLHGICCDIDVETGPRQLPSRHLRKRLEALKSLFPPPEGHAVFPEDLNGHHHRH